MLKTRRLLGGMLALLLVSGVAGAQTAAAPTEAAEIAALRKAANQGDAASQFSLGVRYDTGQGVPKDDAQAVA